MSSLATWNQFTKHDCPQGCNATRSAPYKTRESTEHYNYLLAEQNDLSAPGHRCRAMAHLAYYEVAHGFLIKYGIRHDGHQRQGESPPLRALQEHLEAKADCIQIYAGRL